MSREKQIEEMAETLAEMCDLDLLADCDEKDCSKCMATALYNIGYRKQSEGEWISVEERLPNGSGKFLVVDEEGYMTTATWYPNYGWFMAVCNGTPVTHWMPLPEPPVTKGA